PASSAVVSPSSAWVFNRFTPLKRQAIKNADFRGGGICRTRNAATACAEAIGCAGPSINCRFGTQLGSLVPLFRCVRCFPYLVAGYGVARNSAGFGKRPANCSAFSEQDNSRAFEGHQPQGTAHATTGRRTCWGRHRSSVFGLFPDQGLPVGFQGTERWPDQERTSILNRFASLLAWG